jgi:hypothetical protein
MPPRLRHVPLSEKGFPVPWFVAWPNGKADFRVADPHKLGKAVRFDLCWLCGQTLGNYKCFVIGPMCAVNRNSAEPPCHRDCATYAVQACPFLRQPRMRRNDKDLPPDHTEPAGEMILRNPGVTLIWITRGYTVLRTPGGLLFRIGDPVEVLCFAEGRRATRDEVMASINSGLPLLMEMARSEGPGAIELLHKMTVTAKQVIERAVAA